MQTVEARPARPATAPSGGELAGILRDCAEWVPGSLERLKGYYAARLRVRVGPALADVALAEPSLQSALADAWAEAGEFDPSRESAEQWLFERVRQARGSFLRKASAASAPRAEAHAPVVELPPRPAEAPPPAYVPPPEPTPAPKPAAREPIERHRRPSPWPCPPPRAAPTETTRSRREDPLDPSRVNARRPVRRGGPATAKPVAIDRRGVAGCTVSCCGRWPSSSPWSRPSSAASGFARRHRPAAPCR